MILLDTSFLISALVAGGPADKLLREWLASSQSVRTCTMVWAEFLCGPVSVTQIEFAAALLTTHEPLLTEDAAGGASLFNQTGRRRGSLADCLIAATCLRLKAQLATANRDDFQRFEPMGLSLSSP